MAQVQTTAVAAPIRPAWQPVVILATASLLLVAAIGVALLASGTLTFQTSPRAGDTGSPQWITFRAGERAPLPATRSGGASPAGAAVEELQSRAQAAGAMVNAGLHGSLAGDSQPAAESDPSATSATSGGMVDFRRCEREGC
jgi:hypothetical protein